MALLDLRRFIDDDLLQKTKNRNSNC